MKDRPAKRVVDDVAEEILLGESTLEQLDRSLAGLPESVADGQADLHKPETVDAGCPSSRSYGAYKILTVVQAAAAGTFSSSPDPQQKAVQAFHSSEERLLRGARRGPNASRDQR